MAAPIKVGIVGYGYASKTFHAPLIASVPGLELSGISSRDPAKAQADWPDARGYDSPESLFADPAIDLVVIPTPNDTHHPLAAMALTAGKHVVVDKPFTVSVDDARDLITRAEKHRRLLSVFHNRRWDGDFLTIRRLVESGELGRLVHFESHFDRYRPEVKNRWRETAAAGGGLWYDLGAHLLDQTLRLFGRPETIALDLAFQRDGVVVDDWFHAILGYGALRVILHASVLVPEQGPRFVLHGTSGTFSCHGLDPQEAALRAGLRPGQPDWVSTPTAGTLTLWRDGVPRAAAFEGKAGDYAAYYAAIRDSICFGAANPVPAREALEVMELIELGRAAAAEARTVRLG